MTLQTPTHRSLRFGPFEFDTASEELLKSGSKIKVYPQPLKVLQLFLERPGQLVTREEIRERLWGRNINVDFERGINFCINQIREALADDPERPRYIETLQRRGYRFIAPVECCFISNKLIAIASTVALATGGNGNNPENAIGQIDASTPRATSKSPRNAIRLSLAVGILLPVSIALFFYSVWRGHAPPQEFKLLQLTANSAENPVESGAISPDGKYLAYADMAGMHIKLIKTGETRTVSEPKALHNFRPYWEIVQWFPDGTGFLANATLPPVLSSSAQRPSIWSVELMGGDPRKLQDDSEAWSISTDGSLISFSRTKGRFGYREVWLMGPSGENPRRILDFNENEGVRSFRWLPDERRVAYIRSDVTGDTLLSSELEGKFVATLLPISAMDRVRDFVFLPDGQMLYSGQEVAGTNTCNYWRLQIDQRTGKAVGEPHQMTSWAGFCEMSASVTENGKWLAFIERVGHISTYVADLAANGTRIAEARKFTLNESWDFPADWTADSTALILLSNRDGRPGIFRQALNEAGAEPLRIGPGDVSFPHVTPDGNWLLYVLNDQNGTGSQIMRAPVDGGQSQLVAHARKGAQVLCPRAP